jgi:hypothetical protein
MWHSQLDKSKNNPDNREKYNLTRKNQDTIFFKYWSDNILNWLGSNWVNLSNLLARSWNLDNYIESKLKKKLNSIFNQSNVVEWNWKLNPIKKSVKSIHVNFSNLNYEIEITP